MAWTGTKMWVAQRSVVNRLPQKCTCFICVNSFFYKFKISFKTKDNTIYLIIPTNMVKLFSSYIWKHVQKYFDVIVSLGIEPGYIVFPSQNNNDILCVSSILQIHVGKEIFCSAPGRLDDPPRVSCWPSISSHVIR